MSQLLPQKIYNPINLKIGPMWSYSQWVMERTCGLWTPKIKQKSKYTDRHLSLITLFETQISSLTHSIRLDILSDESRPPLLQWLARHLDHEGILHQEVANSSFSDDVHQSSFHTPAGRIRLNYIQVKAFSEMLAGNSIRIPSELTEVLQELRRSWKRIVGTCPTSVKVPAFKHLRINDRHVEEALFNVYIWSKRFEPVAGRDATFTRFASGTGENNTAFFGRVDFFFAYDIEPCPEEPNGTTLMVVCYEPIRVTAVEGMCRIYGGDPFRACTIAAERRVEFADADEVVALLGVAYCAEKAFFVYRDSCFL